MVVGAVRCSTCSSSSCPVRAREGVRAELKISQVEKRRGGVPAAMPRTGSEAGAGSGAGPGYRKQRLFLSSVYKRKSSFLMLDLIPARLTWDWVLV